MANYSKSGTENLRSNPITKHAASPDQSAPAGKDVGGRSNFRANEKVLTTGTPSTPGGSASHRPESVQVFSGGKV